MANFILSPGWFLGIDAGFELVTMAVATLIALTSYKFYKISNMKKYFYFGVAFAMLATAFATRVLTNLIIYYNFIEQNSFGIAQAVHQAVGPATNFFSTGLLGYRLLTLTALLGIYLVLSRKAKTSKSVKGLLMYFVLIASIFSTQVTLVFHLTAAAFLFFISMMTLRTYFGNKSKKTKQTLAAFTLLMFSQLIFIPAIYIPIAYVVAQVVQLAGFITMLFTFRKVKNAKN